MDDRLEKKLKAVWQEDKYRILDVIKKATPTRDGDTKNGLRVIELADLVNLTPRETQDFIGAMMDWGANIEIKNNRIYTLNEIPAVKSTHENLFNFKEIEVMGKLEQGLKFGVISDTHFGTRDELLRLDVTRAAYRYFEKERITDVLHAGNILAGKPVRRFQRVDWKTGKLDEQAEEFRRLFPKHEGITTHFVLGGTDVSLGTSGMNPASEIGLREDFNDLGVLEADLIFKQEGRKGFKIRLFNDKQFFTYGRSYQPQKKADTLAGGNKPDLWLFGGNQQIWQSPYQGIYIIKLPGLQNQTQRMRDRGYASNIGFYVINIVPREKSIEVIPESYIVWSKNTGLEVYGLENEK